MWSKQRYIFVHENLLQAAELASFILLKTDYAQKEINQP